MHRIFQVEQCRPCNFLALDKTRNKYERFMQPIKTPMGGLRLFNLITVAHERYRSAFYHYLRDTLVADNMKLVEP